ncbi:MAG: gliding motility-associated C-terminal domain-containing protein, partial [Bacteroidales bacterium]|nr:gliding motility-associated C-terminal domain-containing protein [Bacteroidales bacterium]
ATGELVVHAIGGTAPLQYSIDGGVSFQTDNIFPNLIAGNYDIAVSDVNACIIMGNTVTINDPVPLVIDAVTPTDVTGCADNTNGSLLIDVNGGTPPYEYSADGTLWQTDATILNLPVGEYTVMVRDANSCTTTGEPVQILGPAAVTLTSSIQEITCNLEANGEITIHASGGVEPYEYSNNGGTSFVADSVFVGLTPGQYSLVVRDANACISANEHIISITEPDAIVIISEEATQSCLGENTGSVVVEAIGGTGTLSYVLKKGANTVDENTDGNFTGLKVGVYTVELSDENGCGPVSSGNLQVKLSPTADCTVELYNAFSPNGDGINEKWTIYRIWNYPNSTVKIFNNWGTLVFNSPVGYPEPWDGTYNGKELPAGTYYYIIDLDNGEKAKTGTVNIVK